jgi:hypothetical protein
MLGSLLEKVVNPKSQVAWVNGWQRLTSGMDKSQT